MKIDILTLFKNSFGPLFESIVGRAIKNGILDINITDIRDFSVDKHKKCDDTPFGGGEGMILTPQPLFDAIKSVKKKNSHVVYLSPKGTVFNQEKAKQLATKKHLVLICGHYEGIDERVIDTFVDEQISIGDYVLTGGEIPAMVVVDAVSRFVPNVLGNENSAYAESFSSNLLEFPQYTKPAEFKGQKVPDILLSGNHIEIEKWRKEKSIEITRKQRPDLIMAELSCAKVVELTKKNAKDISNLICSTFEKCEGPYYENKQPVAEFVLGHSKKQVFKHMTKDNIFFGVYLYGVLAGVLRFVKSKNKIAAFFVEQNFQGLGVGKMLFNALLEHCKKSKIKELEVWSSTFALNIYEKLGFKKSGRKQANPNGIVYYPMKKQL